jgi:hypothetical protein
MNEHSCRIVSKEDLVAYADGELPQSESERIAEHIATCPDCKALSQALERSLQVTQAIWRTGEAQWPKAHSFDKVRWNGLRLKEAVAVAAGVLLLLGVGAIWRLLSEPSEPTGKIADEAKIAELRFKIAESGHAAQLLAAAELLSRYPGSKSSVEERYRHIVETYPDTAAAAKAKLKMQ